MRFAGVSSQTMPHYLSICKNSEGFSCELRYTVCVTSCGHEKREKLTSGLLSFMVTDIGRRPSDSCEVHYFRTPARQPFFSAIAPHDFLFCCTHSYFVRRITEGKAHCAACRRSHQRPQSHART